MEKRARGVSCMITDVKLANCLEVKCWKTSYKPLPERTHYPMRCSILGTNCSIMTWSWHTLCTTSWYTWYPSTTWRWLLNWSIRKCDVHHTGLLISPWTQKLKLAPHTELWYRTQLDDGTPSSCYMNYWADYWEDFV